MRPEYSRLSIRGDGTSGCFSALMMVSDLSGFIVPESGAMRDKDRVDSLIWSFSLHVARQCCIKHAYNNRIRKRRTPKALESDPAAASDWAENGAV
jgi:hypothetical protein